MAIETRRPVDVSSLGQTKADAVVWRFQEQLHVTIIVKATFAFRDGHTMVQIAPEPIVAREVHSSKNRLSSVDISSDLAPFVPRTDVLLTGSAHAPGGVPTESMRVRMSIHRGAPLLEKSIEVWGDRVGDRITPFLHMPLVYERAFGGLDCPANPLGSGSGGDPKPPNLLDPSTSTAPACFAPIPQDFPARRAMLGKAGRKPLESPIFDIPADFDWNYYHAAPPDQRMAYLHGDEWVRLEGIHPKHALLQSALPQVRGEAIVFGIAGMTGPCLIPLVADTLRIQANQVRCTVVWRGSFYIPDESALSAMHLVAAVEVAGQPIAWPEAPTSSAEPGRPPPPAVDAEPESKPPEAIRASGELRRDKWSTTAVIESNLTYQTLPFDDAPEEAAPAPATVRLPLAEALRKIRTGTMVIEAEAPAEAAGPRSTPFQKQPGVQNRRSIVREEPREPPRFQPDEAPPPAAARRRGPTHAVTREGITIANETPLAVEVVPWRTEPSRDCITVVLKGSCEIVPGGPARLLPSAEPLEGDRMLQGVCVYATDRALYKVRADVVLVGHALAIGGPKSSMEVGFAFGHAGNRFGRRLVIHGDRVWRSLSPAKMSEPEPFVRMPLRHDRAFGGSGFSANPVGVGHSDALRRARREPIRLPNLEDPDRRIRTPLQAPKPACFGPTPVAWADARSREQTSSDAWPFFPEAFDWTRFQAAPPVQRLAFLRGDEPFEVIGCHAKLAVLSGALPGTRARCFAASGGRFEEVPVRLDTVTIDADALRVHLVWRGAIPVADEEKPSVDALHVLIEGSAAPRASLDEARSKLFHR